jgi:hypothetical protein
VAGKCLLSSVPNSNKQEEVRRLNLHFVPQPENNSILSANHLMPQRANYEKSKQLALVSTNIKQETNSIASSNLNLNAYRANNGLSRPLVPVSTYIKQEIIPPASSNLHMKVCFEQSRSNILHYYT